jgi:hypothetical protein
VVFVEDDHVMQTFSAECPDDSFGDCICLWRMHRRRDGIDTNTLGASPKVAALHGVAVAQNMARLVLEREGGYREQVGSPEVVRVVSQERAPRLTR